MATREGTYKSFLQGVSQQTPQERGDGQLGAQVNMVSDIAAGLRRRGGIKFDRFVLDVPAGSYIRMVELVGNMFIFIIDVTTGRITAINYNTSATYTYVDTYFIATSKVSIKSTVSRDNFFILNTEKIPQKVVTGASGKNPNRYGYYSIKSSSFSKWFYFEISHPSIGTKVISFKTSDNTASDATPEWVATALAIEIQAEPSLNALLNVSRLGTTVALEVKDANDNRLLDCQSSTGPIYVGCSGASRVVNKADLLGTLPPVLDGYILAVGNTGNSAYYKYSNSTKTWDEVAKYEPPYYISNTPFYINLSTGGAPEFNRLTIQPRLAGDDDNNPLPKFVGYGITGIGAYQSRLVLLSGSYVNLSKTTEFDQFMRTTVTELLDDDAIETSNAGLSSAQFEYCIAYNKDLVLISQNQQAVIPANNTVLTPKTAVVYPTTKVELSLACEPQVVTRSLYYAYQRGDTYYQVGEFIPNTYTDAQYFNQNLTDHIPLYAQGVCKHMATSTTNNMVVCLSDTTEVLVNQYYWSGDERAQMAFHKWVYPYPVVYAAFQQEFLITFMEVGNSLIIGTQNVQLNQLDDKPVPYLDLYEYVTITDGVGVLPSRLVGQEFVAVIYDDLNMRHKEVMYTIDGSTISCPYDGVLALGTRYTSMYKLTPPFVKDENGKVVGGANTTINSLTMEFKNTGTFNVQVKDTMGQAYDGMMDTAYTWSEAQLGYTWINSIGSVVIPCRTYLSSTECTVETDSTTDLNLVSTKYLIRLNLRYRRV